MPDDVLLDYLNRLSIDGLWKELALMHKYQQILIYDVSSRSISYQEGQRRLLSSQWGEENIIRIMLEKERKGNVAENG